MSSDLKDLRIPEMDCKYGDFDPKLADQMVVFIGLNNKDTREALELNRKSRLQYEH